MNPNLIKTTRFKKYGNDICGGAGTTRWYIRVTGITSQQLARAGSEPNLLQEDKRRQTLSSSQSLEFLNTDDEENCRTSVRQFSLDSQLPRREQPLPPIPHESADDPEWEGSYRGPFETYGNITGDGATTMKWHSLVTGTKSTPFATTGSEPNRLQDKRELKVFSSQSLTFLETDDLPKENCEKSSAMATEGKGVGAAEKTTLPSLPRRVRSSTVSVVATGNREQRPPSNTRAVTSPDDDGKTPAVAASGALPRPPPPPKPSAEKLAYSFSTKTKCNLLQRRQGLDPETIYAEPDKRLDIRKPANLDLQQASVLPSEQCHDEQNIYDTIASPTSASDIRASAGSRNSQPSIADTETGSTGVRDDAVYVMTRAGRLDMECTRQCCCRVDSRRGQDVRAEEDSTHCKEPSGKKTPASAVSPCGKIVSPTSATSDGVGYASLDDVPADLGSLSLQEVCQCLRLLNLHQHEDSFSRAQIDGQLLVAVDQQMLVEELGFKRFDAVKLEKFARHGWRPKMVRASPSQHQLQHHYYSQQPQSQQQETVLYLHLESLYTDVSSPDNCTVV